MVSQNFQATLDSIASLLQDLSARLKNVEAKVGGAAPAAPAAPVASGAAISSVITFEPY